MHEPLGVEWLRQQVAVGRLAFPIERAELYTDLYYQPRRWSWVDPAKEVKAAIDANNHRLKSRTRIIAEGGEDIEDVFDEIAEEEALAKDKNIKLDMATPQAQPAAADAATDNEDDNTDETANT